VCSNRCVTTAIIGLLGVIVGLAVGRGYTFWSTRRSELASAVVATALLSEDLRVVVAPGGASERKLLTSTWHEQRSSLVVHMSPQDFEVLSDSVSSLDHALGRGAPPELLRALTELHELFWEEHEAFILVPLLHYLTGDTISKRINMILNPQAGTDPPRKRSHSIVGWHRPRPASRQD
jgi:hypothetical protein